DLVRVRHRWLELDLRQRQRLAAGDLGRLRQTLACEQIANAGSVAPERVPHVDHRDIAQEPRPHPPIGAIADEPHAQTLFRGGTAGALHGIMGRWRRRGSIWTATSER